MADPILPLSRLEGACADQMEVVRREWPDGIPLTKANARRVAELSLHVDWAAKRLLTAQEFEEYDRVKTEAFNEYRRVMEPAEEEYRRVMEPAEEECRRVRSGALNEYDRVRSKASLAYRRVRSEALLEFLLAAGKGELAPKAIPGTHRGGQ